MIFFFPMRCTICRTFSDYKQIKESCGLKLFSIFVTVIIIVPGWTIYLISLKLVSCISHIGTSKDYTRIAPGRCRIWYVGEKKNQAKLRQSSFRCKVGMKLPSSTDMKRPKDADRHTDTQTHSKQASWNATPLPNQ